MKRYTILLLGLLFIMLSIFLSACSMEEAETSINKFTADSERAIDDFFDSIEVSEEEETTTAGFTAPTIIYPEDVTEATTEEQTTVQESTTEAPQKQEYAFVLNTRSKKIHTTSCRSLRTMNDSNRLEVHGTLEEIQAQYPEYEKCGICGAWYGY